MNSLQRAFKTVILVVIIAFGSCTAGAQSLILGWDPSSNNATFGASPWTPVVRNTNITTSGLIRGSSIGTSGQAANGCWGGAGGWGTSGLTSDAGSFHFTVVASAGYKVSISSVATATRRSNSGPGGYSLYYSVNGGGYVLAGSGVTSSTSGTAGTIISTTTSAIAALQDVAPGTVVKFRINPTGSTTGNYYLTGGTNSLRVMGTVVLAQPSAPVATAATDVTAAGFTANWNAVTGATGYRLDVATDMAFTQLLENYDNLAVSGTSHFVYMGVEPNTTYYYRVRAEADASVSDDSNTITTNVPACGVVAVPVATAQSLCEGLPVSRLVATGTGTFNWYSDAVGGTALASTTTVTAGTYYVSQTIAGCESNRVAVAVTVEAAPAAPTATSQTICGSATVAALLPVSSSNATIKWYNIATGGTALAATDAVVNGTYYVSQTVNGCESPRTTVTVTINPVPGAPTAAAQLFCGTATVASLDVSTGIAPKWYSAETGGTELAATEILVSGTYYVSQTVSGCESPRAAVVVTVNPIPDAPTADAQLFCGAGTVAELDVTTGTGILWYDVESGGTALAPTATLTTNTYYATQTVGGCESARTAVAITVNPIPGAPVADAQLFCGDTTVEDLAVTIGENVKWYTAQTGGTALALTESITTGDYYVSQTVGGCEGPRVLVAITVNEIPVAPTAAPQEFCGAGTVAELVVTTGTAPKWYNAETGGTELAGTEALATGTYYVSQTVNSCESPRTAVLVTVHEIAAAPTAEAQEFCGAGTVAELETLTGENIRWYDVATGGTALTDATSLVTGTYYASQTTNNCESTDRVAVTVTVHPIPAAPAVTQSVQAFCNTATLEDIATDGDNILWYTAATGGTALAADHVITIGTTLLYASQTINDCESNDRTAVAVVLTITPAPTAAAQDFCGTATVSELEATGSDIQWYSEATGGTALADSAALVTGTYYASQTINNCESAQRAAVTVTVNTIPAAPTADSQTFCGAATVSELETLTGENIQWYTTASGSQPLNGTDALTSGNYYASQTINGCESERIAIAVTVNPVPAAPTVANAVQTVCNAATVADLDATGEGILWYTTPTGGTALTEETVLTSGVSVYYSSQTINGCESATRVAVAVVFNITAAPAAEAQSFCTEGTVAELEALGQDLTWYDVATGGTALTEETALEEGTYYVSQTMNGCESPRTSVEVTITEMETPEGDETQEFEEGETLADLEVEGEGIVWYADEALTSVLPETTVLIDGATYYAVATEGDCTSEALAVTVDEVLSTGGFHKDTFKVYPNPVKDILMLSYTENITAISVYNLVGQQVLVVDPASNEVKVDMANLAQGTYLVKVAAGSQSKTIKVIKR